MVACLLETVSIYVNIQTSIHSIIFTTFIYLLSYVQLRKQLSFISTNFFSDYSNKKSLEILEFSDWNT
jgi:hypothetical protein